MKKDYRKALETAAHQMILVHRVDTLVRLILRTIMRNIRVEHAGIFLYDKARDEYIVKVTQGARGVKIPEGFTKVRRTSALIRYFNDASLALPQKDFLLHNVVNSYLKDKEVRQDAVLSQFLDDVLLEMSLYQAKALVPGFFRDDLVGVLFLGAKIDRKPFLPEELGFLSVLASDVVMAIQNARLFEDLNLQLDINKKLFLSTVTALASAIETKDKYTIGHTERVVKFSLAIARNLPGTGELRNFEENLRVAALLHDIGKIGIPERILLKDGPLTGEERDSINRHPLLGADILNPISEFKDIILGVKYHHERYDGKGYPFRLAGEQIPLIAAIIAVADAFDAMTSNRPYRTGLSEEEAIREIVLNRGKQFNPRVVDAFYETFDMRVRAAALSEGERSRGAEPKQPADGTPRSLDAP